MPRSPNRPDEAEPLRIGISSCLLGNEVRYDGGHKRDRFLTDLPADFVEWVQVCPEVELGMGVPRPPLRLVREAGEVRMVEIDSRRDHTRAMERHSARRVGELRKLGLSGYILKRASPSCGMERVEIHRATGMPESSGRGLFAAALLDACPLLPVEEEGRLKDLRLRENFIERVFAYRRLRALFRGRWSHGRIVAFHTAHELQIMAHSPSAHRELGRMVASLGELTRRDFRARYQAGFMAALSGMATPRRNANVLRHAAGCLGESLDPESRDELGQLIQDYQAERVPLALPITLLRHHAHHQGVDYLERQIFLDPHPMELVPCHRE